MNLTAEVIRLHYQPPGFRFYDQESGRQMLLVQGGPWHGRAIAAVPT
jgi:hypothetical protein